MPFTMEVEAGEPINEACARAIAEAFRIEATVTFKFNGIEMRALPWSHCLDLCLIYDLRHELRRLQSEKE